MYSPLLKTEAFQPRNLFPVLKDCNLKLSYKISVPFRFSVVPRNCFFAFHTYGLRGLLAYLVSVIRQKICLQIIIFSKNGTVLKNENLSVFFGRGILYDVRSNLNQDDWSEELLLFVKSSIGVTFNKFNCGTGTLECFFQHRSFGEALYRNGLFARPVNEFKHHIPKGFRGIFPLEPGRSLSQNIVLVNYSSDYSYSNTAFVSCSVYSTSGDLVFQEKDIFEIPPFEFIEQDLVSIIPRQIKLVSGMFVVLEAVGVTLSSIHSVRIDSGGLVAIEHSRPTHQYVV